MWSHPASHSLVEQWSASRYAVLLLLETIVPQLCVCYLVGEGGVEERRSAFSFFLGIFVTNFPIYRSDFCFKLEVTSIAEAGANFSLSWFNFYVTVNSPKTKCCGRKGDNGCFYNWGGVNFTKYGRKVTSVQKPPCSLADGCGLMIPLWCKEGIKLEVVWSCHYSVCFSV